MEQRTHHIANLVTTLTEDMDGGINELVIKWMIGWMEWKMSRMADDKDEQRTEPM